MTTRILSGTYSSGYEVASQVTQLIIDSASRVYGNNQYGIGIGSGLSRSLLGIQNDGTINASSVGVYMTRFGTVTNGSASDTAAQIHGGDIGVQDQSGAPVTNFATIGGQVGVEMQAGGSVTNGSASDVVASINGGANGVLIAGAAGAVTNFGAISGVNTGAGDAAIYLADGGTLTNGDARHTGATIQGSYRGVEIKGAAGTVNNFGNIQGAYGGVYLRAGGSVTNGSAADTMATIKANGASGLPVGVKASGAAGTVTNFGTIGGKGFTGIGVYLLAGGVVTNGSASDAKALIEATNGVRAGNATVANFGRIQGSYTGVDLGSGRLVNGVAGGAVATISGYFGVFLSGGATAINYGDIRGSSGIDGVGAEVSYGSSLTNGSASDSAALIEGYQGVYLLSGASLANFGTIVGLRHHDAVTLYDSTCTLAVEAGCAFQGAVIGNRGTLVLDSGSSAITLLPDADVVISGSMATTTFNNFGVVDVAAGASATLTGDGAVPSGNTLSVQGALAVAGMLSVAGALTTSGTLSGAGTLALGAGQATFNAGTALTVATVSQTDPAGVATVAPGASLTYAGKWTQMAGTLSVGSGANLAFTGAGDSFAGALTGGGIITLSGRKATLASATVDCSFLVARHGALTLRGVIADDAQLEVKSGGAINIASAGATLSGTGSLLIDAGGVVEGVQTNATLNNAGVILGEGGQLGAGKLSLVNQAAGKIAGESGVTVIDTGVNTVVNDGGIGAAGGALVIKGAIDNTGSLVAEFGSTLTVRGAVTGGGVVDIATQGAADFTARFSENVTFIDSGGVSGTLELGKSQGYGGTISGFSTTGSTALDLGDIAFVSGVTKATYSGNASGGVLTVTDGTHTAHINLAGNYTASAFTVSSDGHGGTTVVDPKMPGDAAPPHRFIAAMALMGGLGGGGQFEVNPVEPSHGAMLARPL